MSASKMEKRDNPETHFNISERESGVIDMTVIFRILSILTVVCIFVIF